MEQNYIIATASTADLPREYLDEHKIPFISYNYAIGSESYADDCCDETRLDVYRQMREGAFPSTAAINTYTYTEFLEGLVQTGKDVVFLDMSRVLSSSYRFCDQAIEDLKERYPERTIVNVDTKCVSTGLGMLVKSVVEMYERGESMQAVLDMIERDKMHIIHRFTVDDFKWLKKGGRVSGAAAAVGTILSIKPVMRVNNAGELEVYNKVRGRKSAISSMVEDAKNDITDAEGLIFEIGHADCIEDAELLKSKLLEAFPNAGGVLISALGVVVGAHCGPGLLSLFYHAGERVQQ